ncbi:PREDICTED: LOW QUALITY PROTEIN: DNA ligase 1-like [Dufourea novaeangliae]|uniref:LOW QUALITY PROTEIN: DNA ligase 1-like n=1 Tax=Dufourea novaeangliae TaxID=178035 RepID=UPI000767324B|nr:PREDICTED: LOW QUALITY PROTEIN: DNA ligase 1-like [Dufourea novaeangliae]
MDVNLLLQHSQYALPVGVVLLCAILVFVFGFKKADQPPFAQLSVGSDVDRKFASKKRSKIKEKRSANGQASTEKASPVKKTVPSKTENTKKTTPKVDDVEGKLKEQKQEDNKVIASKKDKDQGAVKAGKENKVEQTKNKKNLKNLFLEKPVDFDEVIVRNVGDWEQAYSRKDKKNKKKEEESPSKKNKKNVKKTDLINEVVAKQKDSEKIEVEDKDVKETENKEIKEKEEKDIVLIPISNEEITKEIVNQQEEEQPKTEKGEKEEKKNGKSKKGKKVPESDSTSAAIPSTPKVDNKLQEQKAQKNEENIEQVSDDVEQKSSTVMQAQEKGGVVFDELSDLWTEAKPQKKSKKKARKDN